MEILIITGIAFIGSILLVLLDSRLNKSDQLKQEIEALLPGYQCGACGFGSCKGMTEAILKDGTSYQKCRPLKGEAKENLEQYLKGKSLL